MSISISSVIGWSGCASTASFADVAACVVADAKNCCVVADFLLEKDLSSSVGGSSRPEQSVVAGKSGGGVVVKKTTTVKKSQLEVVSPVPSLDVTDETKEPADASPPRPPPLIVAQKPAFLDAPAPLNESTPKLPLSKFFSFIETLKFTRLCYTDVFMC